MSEVFDLDRQQYLETLQAARCFVTTRTCRCACKAGGPCEHDFSGWVDIPGSGGGVAICTRCGYSALHHLIRIGA